MKARSMILSGIVASFALTSIPQPAEAQPGCPPGLKMQGRCAEHFSKKSRDGYRGDYRDSLRFQDELDDAYDEGYRDALEDAGLRVGDRLSRDRYRILDRDLYRDRYGRRLDDRYYYAEANGERLLIEAATGAIVDLLLR